MSDKKYLKNIKMCLYNDFCSNCTIGHSGYGLCDECDNDYKYNCVKKYCEFNCSHCGSGKNYIKGVFGVCGRTFIDTLFDANEFINLKKLFSTQSILQDSFPLPIKTIFIPVLYKEARAYKLPELFTDVDAWAVQLRDVFNLRDKEFISRDMKDFFSIPQASKLILSTNSTDDYQEILWNRRFEIDFKGMNFDYWFPGHFSIYDKDNKLYQFMNAKRQQIHASISRSQFVWFRLSSTIPLSFLEPIKGAKNVLISTNNMSTRFNKSILQEEVSLADNFFHDDAVFFIVGGISNLPKVKINRQYHIIGTAWCRKGLTGYDIYSKMHSEFTKDQKKGMLIKNLREEIKNARNANPKLHGWGKSSRSWSKERRLTF